MTPSTPKTFIHLARDAPVGVVLYRRSHLTTYVLKLDHKDRLIKGSRFYGRLFPERCEVSPDGKLFAYFAMMGKKTDGKPGPETWSAVCTPPWLKAHIFAPNGSTYGWGAFFIGNHIVMLEQNAELRDPEAIEPYSLTLDTRILPPEQRSYINLLVRPPRSVTLISPAVSKEAKGLHLLRLLKPHVASGYDMFDYQLKNPDGSDVAGAEDIILTNWAGWHQAGRLVVAAGRLIKIYDVKPGKPLYRPVKTLDIEAAIA